MKSNLALDLAPKVPSLTMKSGNPLNASVNAVVVGLTSDNKVAIYADSIPKAAASKIAAALIAVGATGQKDEITRIPAGSLATADVIVAIGLGSAKAGLTPEKLRRAAGSATRTLSGFKKVAIAITSENATQIGAILEGAAFGAYSFTAHLNATLKKAKSPVTSVAVFTSKSITADYRQALVRAEALAHGVSFARNLINTSPLHLAPADLAREAKTFLAGTPVKVEILDEAALAAGGYGGILGVGQGSTRPPRLIRMQYQPRGATKHVALVGKGITFDTGGISLKPPANMHHMKDDMSGAAAVISTIRAIADLELNVAVTAYAACAENMPGGGAQRPGDVITTYGGRTIEVLNTDAEGRLVMADALVRAAEDKPDVVLDIATLTGAAVVALGLRTAGVMGDANVRDAVKASADRAGEEFWTMPLPEELRPELESLVADIANIGSREGGMLSAGWFLKDFIAEGLPWAHLDIAGPAFNPSAPWGYNHKGAVGFGIRTMVAFIEDVMDGTVEL